MRALGPREQNRIGDRRPSAGDRLAVYAVGAGVDAVEPGGGHGCAEFVDGADVSGGDSVRGVSEGSVCGEADAAGIGGAAGMGGVADPGEPALGGGGRWGGEGVEGKGV